MSDRFKDPESKNKLKAIKVDAQKQIQRNKVIMKDLINKSFLRRSIEDDIGNQDQGQYIEGGKVNYAQFGGGNRGMDEEEKKESLLTQEQHEIHLDYEI